jgi:MFS family permease
MSDRRTANRAAFAIAPGVLLSGLAGGIAFPILPDVGLRTGMPVLLIGAILAANRFGRLVSSPLVGSAADRLGGRRLLLVGLAAQIGVGVCYLLGVTTAHPATFFLAGRLLQGPGSSCVFVAAQALALHAGGREHGGMAAGTVRAAMSIGLPLGVALGGVLAQHFGEAATFSAAIAALVLATASAWVAVPQARADVQRRVPLREVVTTLLRDRRMASIGVLNFAVTFSALGLVLTTVVFVVGAHRKAAASLLMGLMIISMGGATFVSSRLVRTMRGHALACVFATAGLAASLFFVAASHGIAGLVAGLSVLGLSAGTLSASLLAVLGDAAKREHLGAAVGCLQLCGDVGGVLGPIAGSALLALGPVVAYGGCGALVAAFVPVAWGLLRHQAALRSPAA